MKKSGNLAPVLLQLLLQLLLPSPPHHRLRVADAPRERRVRQFWGIQRLLHLFENQHQNILWRGCG